MKQDKWSRSERNGLEHGVHLPEAAAWRSNAAWLAWAAVHLEFLARTYVTGKRRSQLIVKHRGQESGTICAKAQPRTARQDRGKCTGRRTRRIGEWLSVGPREYLFSWPESSLQRGCAPQLRRTTPFPVFSIRTQHQRIRSVISLTLSSPSPD